MPVSVDLPVLPQVKDPFVVSINASGRKWTIITTTSKPQLLLDADSYLRAVMSDPASVDVYAHCHRPIVIPTRRARWGTSSSR